MFSEDARERRLCQGVATRQAHGRERLSLVRRRSRFLPVILNVTHRLLRCEIRASHASHKLLASIPDTLRPLYLPASVKKEKWAPGKFVKGRNEPCSTGQVAWVISQLHGVSLEHVADMTTRNARELFRI